MTWGDKVRQMTDEELAELRVVGPVRCTIPECEAHHGDCRRCALDWLKSEVDDGKQ